MSFIKTLAVFDFDNTLFRSPLPPPTHKGGWWSRPESLGPPHVDEKPGHDMWNTRVVAAARKAISDPTTYSVLMTGRLHYRFSKRVNELLRMQGLHFDAVYLNPGDSATELFKKTRIREMVETTGAEHVEIWEDRRNHLDSFCHMVTQELGLTCGPNFVPSTEGGPT